MEYLTLEWQDAQEKDYIVQKDFWSSAKERSSNFTLHEDVSITRGSIF